MEKPILFKGNSNKDILACCPSCGQDIDWTYKTTLLGSSVYKWWHGKVSKCICGQEIDWSEFKTDIIE